MREYETVIVVRPDSSESQIKQLFSKVDKIIEKNGSILHKKEWGKRELAYPVKKFNQGIYYYYDYAAGDTTVPEVERVLRLNDSALRFLSVKLADEIDIAARKKELASAEGTTAKTESTEKSRDELKGGRDA